VPLYSLPYAFPSNISQPGTQFFDLARIFTIRIHMSSNGISPSSRDLGKGVGVRASYDGNHASNLGALVNIDSFR